MLIAAIGLLTIHKKPVMGLNAPNWVRGVWVALLNQQLEPAPSLQLIKSIFSTFRKVEQWELSLTGLWPNYQLVPLVVGHLHSLGNFIHISYF